MVLMLTSILSTSCFKNFYLTNSKKVFTKTEAEMVNTDPDKYVIIHFSDQNLELTKYTITNDSIIGEINKIEIPDTIDAAKIKVRIFKQHFIQLDIA